MPNSNFKTFYIFMFPLVLYVTYLHRIKCIELNVISHACFQFFDILLQYFSTLLIIQNLNMYCLFL